MNLNSLTNLVKLECSNNPLSNLNISNSPNLEYLNCASNLLDALDVSKNSSLSSLNCVSKNISCILFNNTQLADIPSGWVKGNSATYILYVIKNKKGLLVNNPFFNKLNIIYRVTNSNK